MGDVSKMDNPKTVLLIDLIIKFIFFKKKSPNLELFSLSAWLLKTIT